MWSVLLTLTLALLVRAEEAGRRCCDVSEELYGAKDCRELLDRGVHISDWYNIYPDGLKAMRVYCDMHTDGGGWIVFQRRWDGSVDFTRNWKAYKEGFGSRQEFWLGNEKIHKLTTSGKWEIRVDLHDSEAKKYYAKYSNFKVLAECEKYKLELGPFIGGNAGDSLSEHNHMKFSTFDDDNDDHRSAHCGNQYKGGWWFRSCVYSYTNGLYIKGEHKDPNVGIHWFTARGDHYSFEHAEMKIRMML